jgi:hypothetical protein
MGEVRSQDGTLLGQGFERAFTTKDTKVHKGSPETNGGSGDQR